MEHVVGRRSPEPVGALAWLADWLETTPIAVDSVREVLVVGEPAAEPLLAARLPGGRIVVADPDPQPVEHEVDHREQVDLLVVVDAGAGIARSQVLAAATAVRSGGTVLVLSGARAAGPLALVAGWDPAGAGLELVAFDDVTDASAGPAGAPRRWLRAVYRRLSG